MHGSLATVYESVTAQYNLVEGHGEGDCSLPGGQETKATEILIHCGPNILFKDKSLVT